MPCIVLLVATAYLVPIKTAAALFPLCLALLLLPTAITLYRRHGVITRWRTLSVCVFGYYALTAFCMTIVPLPRDRAGMCVRYADVADPQLVPGNTFGDIWKEAGHRVTFGDLVLHNPAVAGALLNLLLLLPLGVFLRCHAGRGLRQTAATGLGVSLFFELTQYTGLWGVYPCPYRLFDVDDLILNASGAALGWLVAGPVARALPSLESLDARALADGRVPLGRRLTALAVDLVGCAVTAVVVVLGELLTGLSQMLAGAPLDERWQIVVVYLVWFVALPVLTGATPGKWLLRLRLVRSDGSQRPAPLRQAVRALLLSIAVWPLTAAGLLVLGLLIYEPSVITLAVSVRRVDAETVRELVEGNHELIAVAVLCAGVLGWYALSVLGGPGHLGIHERISGVRNVALPPTRPPAPVPQERPQSGPATTPDAPEAPGAGAGEPPKSEAREPLALARR